MQVRFNSSVLVNLRRARLSADGPAVHPGVLAAALGDHAAQQLAHRRARRGGDGIGHHRRADDLRLLAVLVYDGLHQIRLHQPAAVDHRARRRDHLNRRHRDALAKADARQIDVLDAALRNQDARSLAIQVDARALSQAEGVQIPIKSVAAQPQRQLREDRVARVLERLFHRLRAVGRAPAAHRAAADRDAARAVEALLRVRRAAVDRRSRREHLERGAGLIHVAERRDAHQLVELRDVLARRIRRVIRRVHRHGAHRAGVDVHHDRLHLLCLVHLRAFAHVALHRSLHLAVDRQPQRAARLCGHIERHAVGQRSGFGVHLGHNPSRHARKHIVVPELQAALAYAVHVAQAKHLRKAAPHRIPSADVFVKCYSGQFCGVGV